MTSTIQKNQENNFKIVSTSRKFLAIAFIAVTSLTGQVEAQKATKPNETGEKSAGWDLRTTQTRLSISPTSTGFNIVCESNPSNQSGGGMAVGKQAQSIPYSDGGKQEDFLVIKLKEVFITSHQIMVTNSNGKKIPVKIEDGVFTFPENLPDGDYNAKCSWSWGASQSGAHSQKAIDCHLKIEGGVCVTMDVIEKNCAAGKHFKDATITN
jgi:hypothetical protein